MQLGTRAPPVPALSPAIAMLGVFWGSGVFSPVERKLSLCCLLSRDQRSYRQRKPFPAASRDGRQEFTDFSTLVICRWQHMLVAAYASHSSSSGLGERRKDMSHCVLHSGSRRPFGDVLTSPKSPETAPGALQRAKLITGSHSDETLS